MNIPRYIEDPYNFQARLLGQDPQYFRQPAVSRKPIVTPQPLPSFTRRELLAAINKEFHYPANTRILTYDLMGRTYVRVFTWTAGGGLLRFLKEKYPGIRWVVQTDQDTSYV